MKTRCFFIKICILLGLCMGVSLSEASAARIGDLVEVEIWEQVGRFFSLKDPSLRYALIGALLLGSTCGLLGSFLVVRRMALMSDSLSHAVLPGVALGFLWNMTRNPLAIFIGATLFGLLGSWVVQTIRSKTRHKEDAALGFVLAAFFGTGACLMTMIQNVPGGNKAGLDQFMFGQVAVLGASDLWLMGGVSSLVFFVVIVFYKEFMMLSFDPGFAAVSGYPVKFLQSLLMMLIAFTIVSSLQGVGVILVSAMMVIPAATASLLTRKFHLMLGISCAVGMASGILGAFGSFVGRNMPTGPLMVLSASGFFVLAWLFSSQDGVFTLGWRRMRRGRQILKENLLKSIFKVMEESQFSQDTITLAQLQEANRFTDATWFTSLKRARRSGLIEFTDQEDAVRFTEKGWRRACQIVRNHRLWELYLTEAASFESDHVHDEAEEMEHLMDETFASKLEYRLRHCVSDPHGRGIPDAAFVDRHRPENLKRLIEEIDSHA